MLIDTQCNCYFAEEETGPEEEWTDLSGNSMVSRSATEQ